MPDESLGRLIVQLLLDDEEYERGIDDAKSKTRDFGHAIDTVANFAAGVFTLAMKAAAGATAGLALAATKVGSTFEAQMATLAAIRGITNRQSEDYTRLEAKARELGSTTRFSATEAAEAMTLLAQAGLSVNETVAASDSVLNLAAASGISMADAAALTAATLAQFNLDASQSAQVADQLSAVTRNSQFTMQGLAQAMQFAGTAGAGLGMDLAETTSAVAQFRNLGLDASKAGTNFRIAMGQLAKPTREAKRALKEMGLTVEDVDPTLHSFREIMLKLGEAGITVEQSIAIFSQRAGTNVAAIARQMAESTEGYDALLEQVRTSAGATAEMVDQQNATVLGGFREVRSAAEEVLISLFDQFRGPLRGLLTEVQALLQEVGKQIGIASGSLSSGLGGALDGITKWLRDNRDLIAETIVSAVRQVGNFATILSRDILPLLGTMLPILDDLVLLMGLLWATKVIMDAATAIQGVITALTATRFSLKSLMAELTVATGGTYALIAAVGVLVTGLGFLIHRYASAEAAARRLNEAQAELERQTAQLNAQEVARIKPILALQQKRAKEILESSGEITDAYRDELESLIALDAAQVQVAKSTGELIELNGEFRTIQGAVNELGLDAVDIIKDKAKAARGEALTAQSNAEFIKKLIDDTGKSEQQANTDKLRLQERFQDKDFAGVVAHQQDLERVAREGFARAAALENSAVEAFSRNQQQRQRENFDTELELTRQGHKGSEDRLKILADSAQESRNIAAGLTQELALMKAEEVRERIRLEAEARRAEVDARFEELIRKTREAGGDVAEIEAQHAAARVALAQITAERVRKVTEEEERKAADDAAKALETRQKERERFESRVSQMVRRAEENRLTEAERLEREKARVLEEIIGASAEDRLTIALDFDRQIREAEERRLEALEQAAKDAKSAHGGLGDAARKAWDVVRAGAEQALDAVRGLFGAFTDFFSEMTGFDSIMGAVGGFVDDVLQKIKDAAEEGTEIDVDEELRQAAQTFIEEMVARANVFIRALVVALPELISGLTAAVPEIIGALIDAVPEIMDALVDSLDVLAAALPDILDQLLAELPGALTTIIESLGPVIDDLLIPIVEFLLVDLPPVLIDAVIKVVDVLIEEIPRILQTIVDALPGLVQLLIEAAGEIVVALIDALPGLIDILLEGLPDLIESLINGLIEALPGVILAVVEAVPQIVTSLLKAIPQIVRVLVQAIPAVITAASDLMPEIVIALAKSLPDLLPALVLLVPEIIFELIKAIPQIAKAMWDAFVDFLLNGLPEIAKAVADAILAAFQAIGEAIKDFFKGIFGGGGNDKSDDNALMGLEYAPRSMRVTLDPGDAVISPHRNPMRTPTQAAETGGVSARAAGLGGGEIFLRVQTLLDGRIVDDVQHRASELGRGGRVQQQMRRESDVTVGLSPGRFSRWSG